MGNVIENHLRNRTITLTELVAVGNNLNDGKLSFSISEASRSGDLPNSLGCSLNSTARQRRRNPPRRRKKHDIDALTANLENAISKKRGAP